MTDQAVRTQRSFCRICTAVCGILVDVAGDEVVRVREVAVHPDDATAAGVHDGQPVIVRSAQGELTGVTKVDPSVRGGAVSVPQGHQRANVNILTCEHDIDQTTGMTHYSGIPVSLHPVR